MRQGESKQFLIHSLHKRVDLVFSVSSISSFLEVIHLLLVSTFWRAQLEGPQKLVYLFKVLSNDKNLMNDILYAKNSFLSKLFGDDTVVSDGDSLVVDLHKSSFVDQLSDCFQIWCSVSNVGFDELEHFQSGPIQSYKNSIMDLSQSQQLQDLSRSWINSIDTSNSNDNGEFWLRFNKEVTSSSRLSSEFN